MAPRRSSAEFLDTLHRETTVLQATFPDLADALSRAHAILAEGRLFVEEDGKTAMAQGSDFQTWYCVNCHCQCPASTYHNEPCKHRLSLRLYQRVVDALHADTESYDLANDTYEDPEARQASGLDARYLVQLHGKPFVTYAGLLQLAHQRGLQSLTVAWTYNDEALSLARAVATVPFGVFEEAADSTPTNVGKPVALHWRRMSLTRAKARALRDALGVDMVTVEELGEGDTA